MSTDTTLNVRIDRETKKKAAMVLEAAGLTTSVAVRLFLKKVAEDKSLPFEIGKPNRKTRQAIKSVRRGKVKRIRRGDGLSNLIK
jgi:DNA-damage-inducible protein J